MSTHRVFLLSPADCGGERARLVLRKEARFALAHEVQSRAGAPIGDVFTFLSGLYFRGKLAYARAFARAPGAAPGIYVITAGGGLLTADVRINARRLRGFERVPVDPADHRFRRPLLRDARRLDAEHPDCEFILLGSIATGKYVDILHGIFGARLRFPAEFVGRGDMSRGGLLLRCVRDSMELEYTGIDGSARRGRRPPRLKPVRWKVGP